MKYNKYNWQGRIGHTPPFWVVLYQPSRGTAQCKAWWGTNVGGSSRYCAKYFTDKEVAKLYAAWCRERKPPKPERKRRHAAAC